MIKFQCRPFCLGPNVYISTCFIRLKLISEIILDKRTVCVYMFPQLEQMWVSDYREYQVHRQRSYRPMLPILFSAHNKTIVLLCPLANLLPH